MWQMEWNWKDGAKRARSGGRDGECMVMDGNGDGAKSETPSLWNFLILFYYEGPLPNQGEEVVLPWGVPLYNLWVGGEYKSLVLILVEIVQRVETPARVAGWW